MSAAPQMNAAPFLARYEGLRARLPGDGYMRDRAAQFLRSQGLPGVRDEAWKYTNLRALNEAQFHEALAPVSGCERLVARLPETGSPRLVFVDGRFRADLSSAVPGAMQVGRFSHTPSFGAQAKSDRDKLTALNTMLAEDGAVLSVPEGVDGGTVLVASIASAIGRTALDFHPRHIVQLARGARLVLLELGIGDGTYLHNAVTEVTVGEDAVLTHVRLQAEAEQAFQISTVYADVGQRGVYDSFVLNAGARLSRAETHARLLGNGGTVHLHAVQLLRGTQHGDVTTVVRHEAPHCSSRQAVKNVLDGRSRGVFQGRIEVARAAQKTDGYQMNQALLLSPDAEVDTKPELEIFADDVKCSHGATVGALDEGQIFYLRSRGIPEAEARAILVRAFLAEALDAIGHEGARTMLARAIDTWWQGNAA